jgi:hypothetical protein
VKALLIASLGLLCSLLPAERAAAQADLTTARKVACTPERATRCSAPGNCTTRTASPRDKEEVLIIDFADRKIMVRKAGGTKQFAEVVDDQPNGDLRRFAMAQPSGAKGAGEKVAVTLSKSGTLTIVLGNGNKAEASCVVES